jgi:hypothetical protein
MNSSPLVLTKIEGGYRVEWENGVYIGDILMKEDGFYDFWPIQHGGYWPSYILRVIADKLDEINKPWQDQIDNDPNI